MIQNVLRHLGGIDNYGVFSLCLFFGVFAALVAWTLLQTRSHLDRMAHLPLENEAQNSHDRKDAL